MDAALETGGGVQVGWRIAGGVLEVLVEDEGPGLPDPGNLFVPFFTTKANGSGIGLPLSRQIAEAHGGALLLEGRTGSQGRASAAASAARPRLNAPTSCPPVARYVLLAAAITAVIVAGRRFAERHSASSLPGSSSGPDRRDPLRGRATFLRRSRSYRARCSPSRRGPSTASGREPCSCSSRRPRRLGSVSDLPIPRPWRGRATPRRPPQVFGDRSGRRPGGQDGSSFSCDSARSFRSTC